jgi:polyisoprenoid-binding protein YceI
MIKTFAKISVALILLFSVQTWAQSKPQVTVDVVLNPTGDFTITPNRVTGFAKKVGDGFESDNVVVELKQLTTKVSLRDKHVKGKLMVDKYPEAKLVKASGKNGKGQATIEIKGKKHEVKGTYKVSGNTLKAEFKFHLPDAGIKDINYMGVGVEDDVTVHVVLPIK